MSNRSNRTLPDTLRPERAQRRWELLYAAVGPLVDCDIVDDAAFGGPLLALVEVGVSFGSDHRYLSVHRSAEDAERHVRDYVDPDYWRPVALVDLHTGARTPVRFAAGAS